MFGDMLFVEAARERQHATQWSRMASVALQAMAVTALFLYSLLRIEPPKPLTISAPPPQFVPPQVMRLITHPERMLGSSNAISEPAPSRELVVPSVVPHGVSMVREEGVPPDLPFRGQACVLCTGDSANALHNIVGNGSGNLAVKLATPTKPLKISHLDQGHLLRQVQPVYPTPARMARVEGEVVLRALIARDGSIESLQVERGNPLLVRSALDAVKQWRYRPYMLNGEAIEVETEITVNFRLGG